MHWYIVPMGVDGDGNYRMLAGGVPSTPPPASRLHAILDAPSDYALLGLCEACEPAADWAALSTEDARTEFQTIFGRAAREVEVF